MQNTAFLFDLFITQHSTHTYSIYGHVFLFSNVVHLCDLSENVKTLKIKAFMLDYKLFWRRKGKIDREGEFKTLQHGRITFVPTSSPTSHRHVV